MLFAPYHAIVRAVIRRGMADLSAGKTETVARQFRRDATFCLYGDHALGGELHGRDEIGAWFARIRKIFPDLKLTPVDIIVSGGPWATKVATRFRASATLPDGETYRNEGMQYLRLRWAAIVEDRLYEDTVRLCAALRSIANAGQSEAMATQLGSTNARA